MRIVKAPEFRKQADKFANLARKEPVTITVAGKRSVVLVPAEYYDRLKSFEARATKSVRTADLEDDVIERARTADLSHLPQD